MGWWVGACTALVILAIALSVTLAMVRLCMGSLRVCSYCFQYVSRVKMHKGARTLSSLY
jgi:hypothetical protein